jgi:hypothetical protein
MDERATKRVAVDLALEAGLEGVSLRVQVYDLSMDGCSIEAEAIDLPEPGSPITLRFADDCNLAGTLTWVKTRNGGVQFVERLPSFLVQSLGYADSPSQRRGFQDRFGRSQSVPGQRFDVARDGPPRG